MAALDHLPGAATLRDTVAWRRLRHRFSLVLDARTNSHFTGFLRLPTQFEALVGPVIARFVRRVPLHALSICVLGCSNGAEAYTVSSVLRRDHIGLPFRVHGYDIDDACLEQARAACYARDEIFNNRVIPESFVDDTFEPVEGAFRVKRHIADRVDFALGDVLQRDLQRYLGTHDIIFAQNFLFHFKPRLARRALENIAGLLRPGAVLFIDGVDLNLRRAFVQRRGLAPLAYEIERIHEEARRARGVGWPYSYWGLEPFLTARRDWQTRYATIFTLG